MKNDRTKTIFYLDLKHVHKYGCAKFQPNPLFSSSQMATKSAAEKKKKKKKVGNPLRGSRQRTGCPNKLRCLGHITSNSSMLSGEVKLPE